MRHALLVSWSIVVILLMSGYGDIAAVEVTPSDPSDYGARPSIETVNSASFEIAE